MMPPSGVGQGPRRFLIPALALGLCAAQLIVTFPGELIDDSVEQLRQATVHQFGDWHPPVMALVWSWLLAMTGKAGSLLVLQQALHWLGFGLIADGCRRAGMARRAWAILAAGAFPFFLFYDKVLVKDVEMASAYIAAFGICCWFVLARKPMPWLAMLAAAMLLSYGALTRTNAVFALGPLIFMMFVRTRRFGYVKLWMASAAVAIAAVPISNLVNHQIIGAARQDSLQSLQIYDLVGIELRSGDPHVLGEATVPLAALKDCYTAYWWDTFSPWGSCAALRPQLHYVPPTDVSDDGLVSERSALWRRAILEHPFDYLAHRASYFNSSLYFVVPSLHFRFSKSLILQPPAGHPVTQHDIRLDYVKKNFFFWPVVWLAIGCCALVFLPKAEGPVSSARLLLNSGLLYAGAYAVFGVATDLRYYYWLVMAVLVAVLLALPDIRAQARRRPTAAAFAIALLLAVVGIGYASRLLVERLV